MNEFTKVDEKFKKEIQEEKIKLQEQLKKRAALFAEGRSESASPKEMMLQKRSLKF